MSQKAHENSLTRSTCSELWRKWRRGKLRVRHLCRSFRVFCSWRLPRHVQSSCCRWMEPWPWPSFCVHQTTGISSENRQTTIDLYIFFHFFQLSSCELSTLFFCRGWSFRVWHRQDVCNDVLSSTNQSVELEVDGRRSTQKRRCG